MLKHRLLLGPVMILLLVGIIWLDEWMRSLGQAAGLVPTAVLLLLGVEAGRELATVFRARGIAASIRINSIAVCAGVLASSLTERELGGVSGTAVVCTAAAGVMLLAMIYYSRHHSAEGVAAATSATLLAFVYPGLMSGFFVVILKEYGGWTLLGIILVVKCCDIGAYFTGRTLGRHKLIPWLSPGKTWEGLAGGVAASAAAGALAAYLTRDAGTLIPMITPWQGAVIGAVFGLTGQAGDLIASMLKRDAGLKDYSRALPGFGGLMDVADSPLLVAPVAYWLLRLTV